MRESGRGWSTQPGVGFLFAAPVLTYAVSKRGGVRAVWLNGWTCSLLPACLVPPPTRDTKTCASLPPSPPGMPDIERLTRKLEARRASLADLCQLYRASSVLPRLEEALRCHEVGGGEEVQVWS